VPRLRHRPGHHRRRDRAASRPGPAPRGQAPARPALPARDRPARPRAPASLTAPRAAVRLGPPASDAEFLASCALLGDILTCLAAQAGQWAAGAAALGLPPPVTGPLARLAGSLAEAAAGPARAAAAFEEEFAAARAAAAAGMRFTGAGPR
jgi:hypothetical protein